MVLFVNLIPNNLFGGSAALTPNVAKKSVDPKNRFSRHHRCCHREASNVSYSALKKRWLTGKRRYSESGDWKSTRSLDRSLSFPYTKEESQDLNYSPKNTSSWWFTNSMRRVSSMFWKSEEDNDDDYKTMLGEMNISSSKDIDRLSELLTNHFHKRQSSIAEMTEIFQEIFSVLEMDVRKRTVLHQLTSEKANTLMVEFEEHLMHRFYEDMFQKIALEEANSDQSLSDKIEGLSWITAEQLEAKVDESDANVADFLDKAMLDLATINFKESAIEKIESILKCARNIFQSLKISGRKSGADDFLPVLIYVVLQANPAHLHSNVRFILQFCNTERVMKGEEGYYFTHLCSAVSYIENLSAESLVANEGLLQSHSLEEDCKLDCKHENAPCYRRLSRCICDVYHRAAGVQVVREKQEQLWDRSQSLIKQIEQMKESLLVEKTEREKAMGEMRERMKIRYVEDDGLKDPSCPQCKNH